MTATFFTLLLPSENTNGRPAKRTAPFLDGTMAGHILARKSENLPPFS
jgi:hypothetical protein